MSDKQAGPVIRVLKGNPDDIELAALVAVLTAASAAPAAPTASSRPAETWGEPTLMHRGTAPFSPYAYPSLSHLRG
ncbi:MAG TPA: acyl-CoA carboxylase epsilon subunit [Aldersonia sp.]